MPAHKYANFDTAFSALTAQFATIKLHINNATTKINEAALEWACPDCYPQAQKLCNGAQSIRLCVERLSDALEDYWENSHFYESIYWAAQSGDGAGEYELTYQKICEAWAVNDFEGRAVTIAFIDRMRQLIWDEPFYVTWAARPET